MICDICQGKPDPRPEGGLPRHAWAEKMRKTHKQVMCPECRLYRIWVPKDAE